MYVAIHAILYVAAIAFEVKVMRTALIPVASVSRYLPMFILGTLCASTDTRKLLPFANKLGVLFLFFCVGVCISVTLSLWAPDTLITKVIVHAMHIPNAYLGILCMLTLASLVNLRLAPLAFIWRNPYRIYLLHQPLLMALGSLMPGNLNSYAEFAGTAIACIIILAIVNPLFASRRVLAAVLP